MVKNIPKKKAKKKTSKPITKTVEATKVSKPKAKTTKSVKSTTKTKGRKKEQKKSFPVSLIVILIIAVGLIFMFVNSSNPREDTTSNKIVNDESALAAVVNNEEITLANLDLRFSQVPPEYKQLISKEMILEQFIDEVILLQEASKLNIEISTEVVDNYILNVSLDAQITLEEFENRLSSNGLTLDDAKDFYQRSLILNKLLVNEVFNDLSTNEDDILQYYEANIAQFTSPETLNASHILICHNEGTNCVSNLTKDEALIKANEILLLINEDNFADIAKENSNGPSAPNGGNLGFFIKGQMVPEFEVAAFALDEKEVSQPIETAFGYHIIKVFDKRSEEILEIDLVRNQIEQSLLVQKQSELFQAYVSGLRNESSIIVYFKE